MNTETRTNKPPTGQTNAVVIAATEFTPKNLHDVDWTTLVMDRTEIVWIHCPRGGWGYQFRVPSRVKKRGTKRILIEAKKADGSLVERWVEPGSLRIPSR